MLRDLANLRKISKNPDVLKFGCVNHRCSTFVSFVEVSPSLNMNQFDRNIKEKDSWFEPLLESLVPFRSHSLAQTVMMIM